jgi:hypothetical protein
MLPAFFEKVLPVLDQACAGRWAVLCVDDGSNDALSLPFPDGTSATRGFPVSA